MATYLINETPNRMLYGKTLHEIIYHQKPSYDHLLGLWVIMFH